MLLNYYVRIMGWIDDPETLEEISKKINPNATHDSIKQTFCDLYTEAASTKNKYAYRKDCLDAMINLYQIFEELQEDFIYCPNQVAYRDRFQNRKYYDKVQSLVNFDDGIDYSSAPNGSGLYFIGETNFNPFTKEEYYWVKIGKSIHLADRMAEYDTHHPMLWRIDYCNDYGQESYYHSLLKRCCLNTCNHSKEWFRVDKETYLEMCEKGFAYFN